MELKIVLIMVKEVTTTLLLHKIYFTFFIFLFLFILTQKYINLRLIN